MSNTNIYMGKIKQILLQKKDGTSNRQIAKSLEIHRETVGVYVNKAKADPMGIDGLLALPEEELEMRMCMGAAAYSDARHDEFCALLPHIEEQMRQGRGRGVTLKLLWEEYRGEHPDGYGLTQFRFHYNQYVKAGRKVTAVVKDKHMPGQAVYLDFAGNRMHYVRRDTGEVVPVEVFVASMPYSDYSYALAVPTQSSEDFVYALGRLMAFLGGVPHILVPDNLKAAVVKSDRHEPRINDLLADFANHYGCVVQPARVRHPQDKSTVENAVKLVYQRVYAPLRNTVFFSLEELNQAIQSKMRDHNQRRMQGCGCTREELFMGEERPLLGPLPRSGFEIKSSCDLTVSHNCCVYLGTDRHYYSVPYRLVGSRVRVIYTRSIVKVYAGGECVATHARDTTTGRYTIDESHLPKSAAEYRGRSQDYYVGKGAAILPELGEVIGLLFSTTNQAEQVLYKGCDAILHKARETSADALREACETAKAYGKYSYTYLSGFMATASAKLATDSEPAAPPSEHDGIRGPSSFS